MRRLLTLLIPLLLLGLAQGQTAAPLARPALIATPEQALYQWPDDLAASLRTLPRDTRLNVLGRNRQGSWVYAQTLEGAEGWLPIEALTSLPDVAQLPARLPDPSLLLMSAQYWNFGRDMTWLYRYGQSLGNDPNRFAKIGDSITVSQSFLHPIGYGVYELTDFYRYLEPTILAYTQVGRNNSFNRHSSAASVGWTTRNVLQYDGSGACPPETTRLACEYQITRPTIALIMLGTNDVGYIELDEYRRSMRRIIEISFENGVIPAISTIPSQVNNDQRVQAFNAALFELADELDVPLWNYWLLSQGLPNRGLNEDGVHPSSPPNSLGVTLFDAQHLQYGYNVRNLMALQALYLLRWNVMGLRA